MNCQLDHLVVCAATLEQAARWCEATLGVAPAPGGRHPLMGTHNRLLDISAPGFERCYLELLAVDPEAPPPAHERWFGLDTPALQARLAQGPQLVQAVLRSPNIEMMRWGLINRGLQPGALQAASRETATGTLRWRLMLPPPGSPLPGLIDWQGGPHPTDSLPASGVGLQRLQAHALPAGAGEVLRWRGPAWHPAGPAPALTAQWHTPRGPVALCSAAA